MKILSLDTETTTYNNGNPFDARNKLVCYSWANDQDFGAVQGLDGIASVLSGVDLLVGFNFKFDLHWLLKSGVYQLRDKQIWDVQIAEFILSYQTNKFPSLNETLAKYGLGQKVDVVKEQYWDKGINTDEIPWDVLRHYAAEDARLTLLAYHAQRKLMTPKQIQLCYLMGQDLLILQEMEANGILFNESLCAERATEIDYKIKQLTEKLQNFYPSVPINFNSPEQISAFLYGGTIKQDTKELVGFYKGGQKAGQPKFKNVVIEHTLPRLYHPLKGTEMAKEGVFSTNEGTLRKLKGNKGIVTDLLELARLDKLNGTYYRGLVELRKEMNWEEGILHGQFNQTTAATGRLSSVRPNQQNFATELQDIFISEYND